jgi:hypothetical protein
MAGFFSRRRPLTVAWGSCPGLEVWVLPRFLCFVLWFLTCEVCVWDGVGGPTVAHVLYDELSQ